MLIYTVSHPALQYLYLTAGSRTEGFLTKLHVSYTPYLIFKMATCLVYAVWVVGDVLTTSHLCQNSYRTVI